VQSWGYTYDRLRNLTARADNLHGETESFCYDADKRLTDSGINVPNPCTSGTVHYTYADNGNLLTKSDIGPAAYQYDLQHPHAVVSAPGYSYEYDAKGNASSRTSLGMGLVHFINNGFDKPYYMWQDYGGWEAHRQYDADGNLTHKSVSNTDFESWDETIVIDDLYEATHEPNANFQIFKYFVHSPEGVVAVQTDLVDRNSGSPNYPVTHTPTLYVHNDNLGSVNAVVSGDLGNGGSVVGMISYTAFGEQRSRPWTMGAWSVPQDFTGHRREDDLGLVDMKARFYEPAVGRFLRADPIVGDPLDGQSWNRYSYVLNRPLNFTDPTGLDGEEVTNPEEGARIKAMIDAKKCTSGRDCRAKMDHAGKNGVSSSQTSTNSTKNDPQAGGTQPGKTEVPGTGRGDSGGDGVMPHPAAGHGGAGEPHSGSDGLGPKLPPAPRGVSYFYEPSSPEQLPAEARSILGKYFPSLDLSKVRIVIDPKMLKNRGKIASTLLANKIGDVNYIHIRPGSYLYYGFKRDGVAEIGLGEPDGRRFSDKALGLGLLAHEIAHIQQNEIFMRTYGDTVGYELFKVQYNFEKANTQSGWSPMEVGARAIAGMVAIDVQNHEGE
jgi:RHS repeat-associated protein